MPAVLKMTYSEEVRRVQLPQEEISHEQVREAIETGWPELGPWSATYTDEEGDPCVLSPASFSDFVALARDVGAQKVYKLQLTAAQSHDRASQNPPADGADAMDVESGAPLPRPPAAESEDAAKCWAGTGGGCEGGLLRPRRMMWLLSRLRASGALSGKAVAGLAVHLLPEAVQRLAEGSAKLEQMLRRKLPALQPLFADLQQLVSQTPGLKHCEATVEALGAGAPALAREALLELLLALGSLPFDERVAFAAALYEAQKGRLSQLLDRVADRTPPRWDLKLEHHGVTCDGCGASPLRGLRFKCKDCPDYDLCAECFAERGALHADHEFQCIPVDWGTAWRRGRCGVCPAALGPHGKGLAKGAGLVNMLLASLCGKGLLLKGKGKGKGKGKCAMGPHGKGKGKGKGKGEWQGSHEHGLGCGERGCKRPATEAGSATEGPPPCVMGCGFSATWHPAFCCKGCAMMGQHGPRCAQERARAPEECAADAEGFHTIDEKSSGQL